MSASSIVSKQQAERVSQVRLLLGDARSLLVRLRAAPEDEGLLAEAFKQLDELFLLVVVGEFNAGKSAFINALAGERILAEGVTPTTTKIQILQYGAEANRRTASDEVDVITAPAETLRELHIVDTPGTNAIHRHHEALTREFVPRADLVFFVTSADRPFTESEREFLERIREWGKKVVIVINKIDIFTSAEDLNTVITFVSENVRKLLGFTPEIFPVAARVAMEARESGSPDALRSSRFASLERYVVETLDQGERLRLKLLNPLGLSQRLLGKYGAQVNGELALLREDLSVIERIQNELNVYQEDMKKGFRLRLADVDNVLHQLEARGGQFFEETIQLRRIFHLLDRDQLKADFAKAVIGETPAEIGQRVQEIIDWLVSNDLRQWQGVRDQLVSRQTEHSHRVAERMASGFEYDRNRLLDTVGKAAERTLEEYDKDGQASRMADSVQTAIAGTAILEAGAVGLGTAVTLLATTTAADVTGILAAGVMAALGLFVIPHRRGAAKRDLRERIGALRTRLMSALSAQFEREVERSRRRIEEALDPYSRFVRAESGNLTARAEELAALEVRVHALRGELEPQS